MKAISMQLLLLLLALVLATPASAQNFGNINPHTLLGNPSDQKAPATAFPSTPMREITEWGADPTGATDSSTSVANAMAYMAAQGGITIRWPAGTYKIANAQTMTLTGANGFVGDGPNTVLLIGGGFTFNSTNGSMSFKD